MKNSEQLKLIRDALTPWANANKGKVEIAQDYNHLFGLLKVAPGGFRVSVKYNGEDKRGDLEEAALVDRKFIIAFSYGYSLQLEKGDALIKGQSGGRPLADLAEELRDQLRDLQFSTDDTEVTPDDRSTRILADLMPGFDVDGFFLEIWLGCILPPPGTEDGP